MAPRSFATRPVNTPTPAVVSAQLPLLGAGAPGRGSLSAFRPPPGAAPARYPILPKGTLVKVGISWLVDHLLEVVADPGPARRMDRVVEVRRQEPERRHEVYRLKRCNITEKGAAGLL